MLDREIPKMSLPYRVENPLISEGDLRGVYGSRRRLIPEMLLEDAFSVDLNVPAQIMGDDAQLIEGFRKLGGGDSVLRYEFYPNRTSPRKTKIEFSGTYFIVNIGHAHLPGIAVELARNGIESYFYISGPIHPRFKQALKYWAGEYQEISSTRKQFAGFATLTDHHRNCIGTPDEEQYNLPRESFPTENQLRQLGIERIIFLDERPADVLITGPKEYPIHQLRHDLKPVAVELASVGFPVTVYGIDNRSATEDCSDESISKYGHIDLDAILRLLKR